MNWLTAASDTYEIELNGEIKSISERQIISLIKKKLKNSFPVRKIFKRFGVSLDQLDNLDISIVPLEGRYALTDDKEMRLNKTLFTKGTDFFKNYFFVPLHELVHFLSRLKERRAYLNDPEEISGFILAIAHYLSEGKPVQEIWRRIFPAVKWHFHDDKDAEIFFRRCLKKAKALA